MELEERQIVLCTVEKIIGTTVFVKIEGNGEGTIITSEIAPGRIRNLRDYVVPNKKIACKILKISNGNIYLSLRRVTSKEKKQVLETHKKEKNISAVLKTILDNSEEVIEKIKKNYSLVEFVEKIKENPKLLEKFVPKEKAEKLFGILTEKKEKEVSAKKKFSLKCEEGDGIKRIKKILPSETKYISAGNFSLEIKNSNYKDANNKLDSLLNEIEKKAKQENCVFTLKTKRKK